MRRLRRRWGWWAAGAVAVLLVGGFLARGALFGGGGGLGGSRTSVVERTAVTASVTTSGSVEPAGLVNLDFRAQGPVTEIDVHVGDQVAAGQVLARLDPSTAQSALAQAEAGLQQAQANLLAAQNLLTPAQLAQLQHSLAAAQTALRDVQQQVSTTAQLDTAQVAADRQQLSADQARYQADCSTITPLNLLQCEAEAAAVTSDQSRLAADLVRQQEDQAAGKTNLDQAQAQVTAATDAIAVQSQPRPGQVQAAQAQVATAQAQVAAAQAALDQTTLSSPVAGIVQAINGGVGEVAGAGAGTSLAPGSSAPAPLLAPAAQVSAAFITIQSAGGFQAVVPFAETDASQLALGQSTTVTFDAVPGLTLPAHLVAVAPASTVVSNVVDYLATFGLDSSDARLRTGMTANVTVVVSRREDVLAVPNAAVQASGGTDYVLVSRGGRTVQVDVGVGLVGDTLTEITSGLVEGQTVLLPAPLATPTARGIFGGG